MGDYMNSKLINLRNFGIAVVCTLVHPASFGATGISIYSEYAFEPFDLHLNSNNSIEANYTPDPLSNGGTSTSPYFSELGTLAGTIAETDFDGPFESNFGWACPGSTPCYAGKFTLSFSVQGALVNKHSVFFDPSGGNSNSSEVFPTELTPLGYAISNTTNQLPDFPNAAPVTLSAESVLSVSPSAQIHEGHPTIIPTGKIFITETYTPHSTSEYVRNIATYSSGTNLHRAERSWKYATRLRISSASTSSENLNLRDAEYAFFGYYASQSGERKYSPVGAFGYLLAKKWASSDRMDARLVGRALLSAAGLSLSTSGLPGTSDDEGGLGSNTRGWLHGVLGGDISTLDQCLESIFSCGSSPGATLRAQGSAAEAHDSPQVLTASTDSNDVILSSETHLVTELPSTSTFTATAGNIVLLVGSNAHINFVSISAPSELSFESLLVSYLDQDGWNEVASDVFEAGSFRFLSGTVFAVAVTREDFGSLAGLSLNSEWVSDGSVGAFQVAEVLVAVPEPKPALLMSLGILFVLARQRSMKRAALST